VKASDTSRVLGLADVFFEDVAMASGVEQQMLGSEFHDLCEAMALVFFASGDVERKATVGALVYCASRLP